MKRRDVIRSVAASGIVSITAGTAAGLETRPSGPVSATDLDAVRVVRDGDVVRTVTDPADSELDQLLSNLDDDESLLTPEECCLEECREDCAYCEYGCCDWKYDC
jgi:hypothetical protein